VGYAGGSKPNPTYLNLGTHSEAIQIEYDPDQITYRQLLEIFWSAHSPTRPSPSRQYASMIFFHNEEQEGLARETKSQHEAERERELYTDIVPYVEFWQAEDYHQKYRLRGSKTLMSEFEAIYPNPDDFIGSTAAARVNGYLAGYGTWEQLEQEIDQLGLSDQGKRTLREVARRRIS